MSAALSAHMASLLGKLAVTARHRTDPARKLPDMDPGCALWPSIGAIRDLEKQEVERWTPPPFVPSPHPRLAITEILWLERRKHVVLWQLLGHVDCAIQPNTRFWGFGFY